MTTASEVMKTIKDNDVKYVDLRFTDPRGKMQHVTMDVTTIDEDAFADGIMFDGSSIAGWKAIHQSDMTLMMDPESAAIDPFFAQPTLAIFCDVLDPGTGEPYNRDPRTTAKKALAYLQSTGIGDTCYFGPEAEFFIFDDVRFCGDALQHRLQGRLRPNSRPTATPTTKAAISATARAPRAATSPCRRSTPLRTSAPTC